jgi:hypothetical protein
MEVTRDQMRNTLTLRSDPARGKEAAWPLAPCGDIAYFSKSSKAALSVQTSSMTSQSDLS